MTVAAARAVAREHFIRSASLAQLERESRGRSRAGDRDAVPTGNGKGGRPDEVTRPDQLRNDLRGRRPRGRASPTAASPKDLGAGGAAGASWPPSRTPQGGAPPRPTGGRAGPPTRHNGGALVGVDQAPAG